MADDRTGTTAKAASKTIRERKRGRRESETSKFFSVETSGPRPRLFFSHTLSFLSSLSLSPRPNKITKQAEWRGIGVQQSRGWVHYAIHRPEPHVSIRRSLFRVFFFVVVFFCFFCRRGVQELKIKNCFPSFSSFPSFDTKNRLCSSAVPRTTRPRSSPWPRRTTRRTSRRSRRAQRNRDEKRENKRQPFHRKKTTLENERKTTTLPARFPLASAHSNQSMIFPFGPFLPRSFSSTQAGKGGGTNKEKNTQLFVCFFFPFFPSLPSPLL